MPARKPKPGESFGDLFPEIAKQWHPTNNGNLTPYDFTKGSEKKVWWKCPKGDDHEWESNIYNRIKTRCGVCYGSKVVKSVSLAFLNPGIAKEWHPTKNGNLNPIHVRPGSSKKVWWKCDKGEDHEWKAVIKNRVNGNGCSVCVGKTVVNSNCLATKNSFLSKEWHPTKNGNLTPLNIFYRSSKKVWWKCPKGDDHEWEARVDERAVRGDGCSVCAGKKVVKSNSLASLRPDLVKVWHPVKNGNLNPFDVTEKSSKKVWWKCPKGDDHEWNAKISSITRNENSNGCPVCRGLKVVKSNSLSKLRPDLVKEWHPTKNDSLSPENFTVGSSKKVWWKCPKGEDHEWNASIVSRSSGYETGCPICSGNLVVNSNSLSLLRPDISDEWHPTKNNSLSPKDFPLGSNKQIWWLCRKNKKHIWKTSIYVRTNGFGCPYCTLTPQSREELIIAHELITIFKGINPKGFKTRVKGKLRSIDIYIPDLKLGIEFDGSYWHKDKRALDKLKTEELEAEGFNIIRVRQKPLKRIFEDDVMAEKKYDGKKITYDILTQIMKDYKLGQSTILKINKYIEKPHLQNEKGLEKYIDMILTEKAEKK